MAPTRQDTDPPATGDRRCFERIRTCRPRHLSRNKAPKTGWARCAGAANGRPGLRRWCLLSHDKRMAFSLQRCNSAQDTSVTIGTDRGVCASARLSFGRRWFDGKSNPSVAVRGQSNDPHTPGSWGRRMPAACRIADPGSIWSVKRRRRLRRARQPCVSRGEGRSTWIEDAARP